MEMDCTPLISSNSSPEPEDRQFNLSRIRHLPQQRPAELILASIHPVALGLVSPGPGQRTDVSARFPKVLARLRKMLHNINASVMADAPEW